MNNIRRISKLILILILINSMIFPSFASLQSVDGSIFVTKAEFDSALAEFNSRLTTFESGINSKIDSQVTSYLDRNGIWSKKTQLLMAPFYGKTIDIKASAAYQIWMKDHYNRNIDSSDCLVYYSHINKLKCVMPLVDVITKSGLCFVDYYVWQWDISMATGFNTASSATAYAHNYQYGGAVVKGWSGNLTYAFYEDKQRLSESSVQPDFKDCHGHVIQKSEYAGNMSSSGSYLSGAYMINQKAQGTSQFFISKNSKLYLCMFVYGGGGSEDSISWCACNWKNVFNTTGVPMGPACDIAEVAVY